MEHVESNTLAFQKEEPRVAVMFCRFVVKKLLASPCFHVLGQLASLLAKLAAVQPSLLPVLAQAIIGLRKYWGEEQGEGEPGWLVQETVSQDTGSTQ